MHGLCAGLLAGGDDLVHHQIRLFRRGRADTDCFVGEVDVQRVLVGFGTDRNGLMPILRAVLMTRQAISPRLAIRILVTCSSLNKSGG